MKLEIFTGEPKDTRLRLKLVSFRDGIHLVVLNEDDTVKMDGYILAIYNDGRIKRHRGVDRNLGFDLDAAGRIKEVED